jgi:hypothetical protein
MKACADPFTVFYKDAVHVVLGFCRSTYRDLTKEGNLHIQFAPNYSCVGYAACFLYVGDRKVLATNDGGGK